VKIIAALLLSASTGALACGDVVTLPTDDGTTTRYAFSTPQDPKGALILLAGGGGYLDLDAQGCAQKLEGNSEVVAGIARFVRGGRY
jgi:hypothetical protein